ncbi:putative quinol monooxygenase [Hymenobacter ginsengisoli]|uniref:Quinol monooxygenase n=1 Tax=Hymenobacter ginsengisoli TaxID=1051626 RepID=A0ABP8QA22_9BACT|nr:MULTISPECIES: putative quinol monooxygenase [unclassified Hymenobacter]MBO2030852.1 antibiotic biosynthesis monooxygenase [Hymenobacter sp. BT559]
MDSSTSNSIAVAAEWRVQPGQEETVRRLMLAAAAAVREHEPGNLLYVAHQDPADPTHFLFYEQYADQQALEAHRDSAHYQTLVVQQIVPLLVERTVTFYKLLG